MSEYRILIHPAVWKALKRSPGDMRQRIRRAVDDLQQSPRPANSKALELPSVRLELRRLRLDDWRVVYAINEDLLQVQVLTIRQRPPYDYRDLEELLAKLS